MIDLKLTKNGDLEISNAGDISITDSVRQAVRIRLLWFLEEWRLCPELGIAYFENILIKNPNELKIKNLIRKAVMKVDEVTDVTSVVLSLDSKTRESNISVTFTTKEDTFREEVKIRWHNMD